MGHFQANAQTGVDADKHSDWPLAHFDVFHSLV
jgi:hypothetical protein